MSKWTYYISKWTYYVSKWTLKQLSELKMCIIIFTFFLHIQSKWTWKELSRLKNWIKRTYNIIEWT